MFRCYGCTIIRERNQFVLAKVTKYSIKIHRCVVDTVVVWLHILGHPQQLYRIHLKCAHYPNCMGERIHNSINSRLDDIMDTLYQDLIYAATLPPYLPHTDVF